MKSIGDFMPAPTIRDIPLPAPTTFSTVSFRGSNSGGVRWMETRRESERLFEPDRDNPSLEPDLYLDLESVPLSASLSDLPRCGPVDEVLVSGVSILARVSLDVRTSLS